VSRDGQRPSRSPAERLPYVIAAPEVELGPGFDQSGVYPRDSATEPPCSVCVSQLASISTIAPKSLHDSWDTRQWFSIPANDV